MPALSNTCALLASVACWTSFQLRDVPGLDQIVSGDPGVRQQAWQRVLVGTDHGELAAFLPRINQLLQSAGEGAFAEAAERLRDVDLWGWEFQPPDLILRELEAAALSADDGRHDLATRTLSECPLTLGGEIVLPLTDMLVLSGTPHLRRAALDAACLWAGRDRAATLASLTIVDDALERDRLLAVSWSSAAPHPEVPEVWADDEADIVEAALLAHVRLDPEGPARLALLRDGWDTTPRPAFEAIEVLAGRSADGTAPLQPPGSLLSQSGAPGDDPAFAALAADPAAPLALRRLAVWRLSQVPQDVLEEVLAAPVADDDGHVYATALLAERCLGRPAAVSTAERWIRSLDDDQNRCGALLAMLAGGPRDLLQEAYAAEDVPEVKRLQRLALAALGQPLDDPVALELGVRTLTLADGGFDPDVAQALLAAGHLPTLSVLTSQPHGDGWDDYCRSIQARRWLLERMVPSWHAAVGRPLVSDPRAVRLHFDDLRAFRLLTQRRLAFDRSSFTYGP